MVTMDGPGGGTTMDGPVVPVIARGTIYGVTEPAPSPELYRRAVNLSGV